MSIETGGFTPENHVEVKEEMKPVENKTEEKKVSNPNNNWRENMGRATIKEGVPNDFNPGPQPLKGPEMLDGIVKERQPADAMPSHIPLNSTGGKDISDTTQEISEKYPPAKIVDHKDIDDLLKENGLPENKRTEVINSFTNNVGTKILEEDTVVSQYSNKDENRNSPYYSPDFYTIPLDAQKSLDLPNKFDHKNSAEKVVQYILPAGTIVLDGEVSTVNHHPDGGGGRQFYRISGLEPLVMDVKKFDPVKGIYISDPDSTHNEE